MGNWRTVMIEGTMSAADAAKLRDLLDWGDYVYVRDHPRVPPEAECLSFSSVSPGLAGLGAWPAERMDRGGNLHERGYSVTDVAIALRALVEVAPSMLLKIHCGADYESETCIATISVGEGLVVTGKPERDTVTGATDEQVFEHLAVNMTRPR